MGKLDDEAVEIIVSYRIANHLQNMVSRHAEECLSCEVLNQVIIKAIRASAKNAHNRVLRMEIKRNKYKIAS